MPKSIKWGVIGSGGIARRRTIPEGIIAAENAQLTTVYDINQEINNEVANEFNTNAVGSMEEFLAQDIDSVYIASPAYLHCEHVITSAKAGKHILCEKPLGMTVEEAEKILSVCDDSGVILGTAFMMRFHTQHQAALKMIEEGKLGTLTFGRAQLSCWYPPIEGAWRQDPTAGGGGSLMDMGGHCIDLMEMFFGKVTKVNCIINNIVHPYKSEDGAVATLFFENGAIASVDTFFCIPDNSSKNVLELYGSKGSILAKGTIGQGDVGEMIAYLEEDDTGYDAQQSRDIGSGFDITPNPQNTYLGEIEEFNQAIIESRSPLNSAQLGSQSQKILAACYESACSGRTIDI